MTISEIIESLEEQAQEKDCLAGCDTESIFTEDAAVLREAAKLLRKQIPPNDPLTLEQLLDMEGEPVWVCNPDGSSGRYVLIKDGFEDLFVTIGGYGKLFVAYRKKPEEGTT